MGFGPGRLPAPQTSCARKTNSLQHAHAALARKNGRGKAQEGSLTFFGQCGPMSHAYCRQKQGGSTPTVTRPPSPPLRPAQSNARRSNLTLFIGTERSHFFDSAAGNRSGNSSSRKTKKLKQSLRRTPEVKVRQKYPYVQGKTTSIVLFGPPTLPHRSLGPCINKSEV